MRHFLGRPSLPRASRSGMHELLSASSLAPPWRLSTASWRGKPASGGVDVQHQRGGNVAGVLEGYLLGVVRPDRGDIEVERGALVVDDGHVGYDNLAVDGTLQRGTATDVHDHGGGVLELHGRGGHQSDVELLAGVVHRREGHRRDLADVLDGQLTLPLRTDRRHVEAEQLLAEHALHVGQDAFHLEAPLFAARDVEHQLFCLAAAGQRFPRHVNEGVPVRVDNARLRRDAEGTGSRPEELSACVARVGQLHPGGHAGFHRLLGEAQLEARRRDLQLDGHHLGHHGDLHGVTVVDDPIEVAAVLLHRGAAEAHVEARHAAGRHHLARRAALLQFRLQRRLQSDQHALVQVVGHGEVLGGDGAEADPSEVQHLVGRLDRQQRLGA
eukprot:scaffold343_cov245-Pinguiococcus_pyrenoidosus.AAC.30